MPKFAPYKSMHDVSHLVTGESQMKNDGRYNALSNLDNDSDASTDVGDWEVEEERPRGARRSHIWTRVKWHRWLFDTGLLLVIVGLLVEKRWMHNHSHQYEFAGDITGFAPKCRC